MSKNPIIWFTADTHWGHANIIEYCKRPFKSAEEMDETILSNINNIVQPEDILYHLGDFAFARGAREKEQIRMYRDRINCRNVYLIAGNHDPHTKLDQPAPWLEDIFSGVYVRLSIKVPFKGEQQRIVMDHYAGRVWNRSHHGAIQLHGHSHGTLQSKLLPQPWPKDWPVEPGHDRPDEIALLSHDVGVDCNNFMPICMEQIADIMATKQYQPVDHHGAKQSEQLVEFVSLPLGTRFRYADGTPGLWVVIENWGCGLISPWGEPVRPVCSLAYTPEECENMEVIVNKEELEQNV